MMNRMLKAALEYIEAGFFVFPVHQVINGRCTCGKECQSPGKHPRTPNGVLDASDEPEQIRHWWRQQPDSNIGIALGKSGLVAVDVDADKPTAVNAWNSWCEKHPELRKTLIVKTPGGGEHYYFNVSKHCVPQFKAGVELRTGNQYVVAPPSIHPNGGTYEWGNELDIADLPEYLVMLMSPRKITHHISDDELDLYTVEKVAEALQRLDQRRVDEYDGWIKVGMALHEWDAQTATDVGWHVWNAWSRESTKFEAEVSRKTWDSFKGENAAGEKVTIGSLFHWAEEDTKREVHPFGGTPDGGDDNPWGPIKTLANLPLKPEPIDWLIKPLFARGHIVISFGAAATFKSLILQDMAMSLITGKPWLNPYEEKDKEEYLIPRPRRVLYIDLDQGKEETESRLRAAIAVWKPDAEALERFAYSAPGGGNILNEDDVEALVQLALAHQADVIIIDTIKRSYSGIDENSTEVDDVMRNYRIVAERTRAAIWGNHHENRAQGYRGNASYRNGSNFMLQISRNGRFVAIKEEKSRNWPWEELCLEAHIEADRETKVMTKVYFTSGNIRARRSIEEQREDWLCVGFVLQVNEQGKEATLEPIRKHLADKIGGTTDDLWRIPMRLVNRTPVLLADKRIGDRGRHRYVVTEAGRRFYEELRADNGYPPPEEEEAHEGLAVDIPLAGPIKSSSTSRD